MPIRAVERIEKENVERAAAILSHVVDLHGEASGVTEIPWDRQTYRLPDGTDVKGFDD